MEDDDFKPRPNDFLIEPMFAPFETKEPAVEIKRSWLRRALAWLLGPLRRA